ncbi:LOW QUALITY PROTEIN: olfactory receptor 52B2-like [Tautogolabrus adspersus]
MAYDRFIAICFSLRYHSFVTKPAIGLMLLLIVCLLSVVAHMVKLIDRLSFCGSLVVNSYFCDHSPVFRLACNDISFSHFHELVAAIIIIWLPPLLIAVTYLFIFTALSRIASGEERLKALKTCASHLILVARLFFPIIGTNIASQFSFVHPNARIISYTLTNTIPALLKPIVYSLKTEEVLNSFKELCKTNSINNTTSSKKGKSVLLLS